MRDVVCPVCRGGIDVDASVIACAGCGQRFPLVGGMPVLLPQPEAHVELWRGQLGLLLERGQKTLEGLTETAAAAGLGATTRARLPGSAPQFVSKWLMSRRCWGPRSEARAHRPAGCRAASSNTLPTCTAIGVGRAPATARTTRRSRVLLRSSVHERWDERWCSGQGRAVSLTSYICGMALAKRSWSTSIPTCSWSASESCAATAFA